MMAGKPSTAVPAAALRRFLRLTRLMLFSHGREGAYPGTGESGKRRPEAPPLVSLRSAE